MKRLSYFIIFFLLLFSKGFSQSKFYVHSNKPTFDVDEGSCNIGSYTYEYQISHTSGIYDVPSNQIDIRLYFREGYNDDPSYDCNGPCGQFAWHCEPEINETINPFDTYSIQYSGPNIITCPTDCTDFPITYSSVLIPKMNLLNTTVCPEEKLFDSYNNQTFDLSDVSAFWFYKDGLSWQKIPNYSSIFPLNKSIEEIFGVNYTEYFTGNLELKYVVLQNSSYSKIYNPIVITDCSPSLVQDPPISIPPTCSNTDNGSFTIEFDRDLAPNETMNITLEQYDPDFDIWNQTGFIILNQSDIVSQTYTWSNELEEGKYQIEYISKIDGQNPSSIIQSQPFNIEAPDPVEFDYSKTDVLCKGDNNGTITFDNTIGGTESGFEYSIDNGANWQSSNTFTDLLPTTYNLLAKDSKDCISETSASVTLTEPPEALSLSAVKVLDPSANGVSDGEISIDVYGGTGTVSYQWTKDGVDYATTQNITGFAAGL
ncbi:MAG: SprB repeat-containing protein [Bacteroidota bacterium]